MTIFDKFSLDGRVAVVTGGNRGIGRGICNGFAEAGAQVVIAARDEAKSAEAVAQIEAAGGKAVAIRTDVAQRDSLQHLHDDVIERFGRVDVLVNNAGIGFHADALELDDAEWRRLFDTNLDAVWKACQIFGRIARVQLHTQTAIAAQKAVTFFLETGERHNQVFIACRKVAFGINRDPFLFDHAVILNDRHKAPP